MKVGGLAEQALREVCKINGSVLEGKDDSSIVKEEKPSVKSCDAVHVTLGRKRSGVHDIGDLVEDDDVSGNVSEQHLLLRRNHLKSQVGILLQYRTSATTCCNVWCLGSSREKAVGSLGILISSISTDLLAEVVMANIDTFLLNKSQGEEEHHVATVADSDLACGDMDCGTEQEWILLNFSATSYEIHDVGNLESIPGLDSTAHDDRFVETLAASSLASADLEEGSQEQVTSLGRRSQLDLLPSMSTDRSEELSPKSALTDANSIISSTETSAGLSSQFVLPKLLAPVIDLTDEQKDLIQKLAYARIVDAYKQIAVAGGSHVRFSLLAYLGVQVAILAYRID
ncbi:hypothetical protein AAG906_025114 [Vitis piasezkii]